MKGTGAKRNVFPGSCVSTGAKFPVAPVESAPMGTTRVSQYQKGKIHLDFTKPRGNEWQCHRLGRMQVCTLLQTDNHASTPPFSFFYRPDALPAAQPTASKH